MHYKLVITSTMQKDEITPTLEENPSEEEQTLELEPTEEATATEEDTQGSDPLDTDDIEAVRKEGKKFRAIANRKPPKAKEEEKPTEEAPKEEAPKEDYLKVSDFELENQRSAIKLATLSDESDSDEVKAQKADVLANWDEIRKNYTPRRGKSTPENILEDIKDATAIFNNRRPPVEEAEEGEVEVEEITKTEAKAPAGNPPKPKAPKAKNPPNFKLPTKPEDWYNLPK